MNSEIINKLRELKPILKDKYGIEEFAVFGSQVRNDYTKDSDVDIAILKMKKKDYFILIEAMNFLKKRLNKKVDMGFFHTIRPFIRKRVSLEMHYV